MNEGITFTQSPSAKSIERRMMELSAPLGISSFPMTEKFRIPATLLLDDEKISIKCVIKGY